MVITRVSVGKVEKEGSNIKGMATVTIDNSLVLSGFKIMDSVKGLFVSNPSYKDNDGNYKDIFFIMNKKDREFIHKLILDKYIQKFESTLTGNVDDLMKDEDLKQVEDGEVSF